MGASNNFLSAPVCAQDRPLKREAGMPALGRISLLVLLLCGSAQAQTLEGYWQDTARRILFARDAPPSYVYGAWTMIDQDQTYPAAKEIRRSAQGLAVVDLNFDDGNYEVKT